jgi:hypothetical protein
LLTMASLGLATLVGLASATKVSLPAGTHCVKPGGGGGCHATIGQALAAAAQHDTILVAAGSYLENVHITQTVTLQGGWNESFTLRDIGQFSSTIMPANNTQSVVAIGGDFNDTSAVAPTLDGFVITGGRADLGSNHGGGLSIRDSDAIVISNTIKNNVAFLLGGGVWVQRGAPLLQGNQIMDNRSVGLGQQAYGGGVQLENSPATLIENFIGSNVVSGTEAYGGGVELSGSGVGQVMMAGNVMISNTIIAANLADGAFGGAIAVSGGNIQIADGVFISNTAGVGGAIFIGGNLEDCCNATANNNLFQTNSAIQGGALGIEGDVEDCCSFSGEGDTYQQNSATQGGALYLGAQSAVLSGSVMFSNTAALHGGGAFIDAGGNFTVSVSALIANWAAQDGGAIHNGGAFTLTNSTVSGNQADNVGGGIANFDSAFLLNATVSDNSSPGGAGLMNGNLFVVQNSLIALNNGDNCNGGLFSLGHNLEDGGTCAMGHGTDQNNTAPSMENLGQYGGETLTHALMAGSPAIDAGDPAACAGTDQRGAPRSVDGDGDGVAVCDIGAYEYGALLPRLFLPLLDS